ncbi:hypothetical protein BXZ70DRAFT_1012353 [Cristinia sonorae]|uniref:Uncharacterized protein n=1 Tax=Cristinia sonorae TaxID=1940300 RepID=A0A8K0XKH3_9AGAR|nr:hypothetical protein BXZ70DRAFT_1012353 [Cristinia sonorae]
MRIPLLLPIFSFASVAFAWQWEFNTGPLQCEPVEMSIVITGNKEHDGSPPWNLLFVPTGSPSQVFWAPVFRLDFPDANTTIKRIVLNYPTGTEFVVVGSNSTGFGNGGTSTPFTVMQTSTAPSTCVNYNDDFFPWNLTLHPTGSCVTVQMTWESDKVVGTPTFLGIVPGGDSFIIPHERSVTNNGFYWRPTVPTNTTLYVVAGDLRGPGTGGVRRLDMSQWPASGSTCEDATNSASSGSSQTSTSTDPGKTAGVGDGSDTVPQSKNLAIIIGPVVAGGVGLILIIAACLWWRRRRTQQPVVDITIDDGVDGHAERYTPQPYMSETTHNNSSSSGTVAPIPDLGYNPAVTTATRPSRKTPPSQPVTVSILQHEDSQRRQPEPSESGVSQLVELPPAYSEITSR